MYAHLNIYLFMTLIWRSEQTQHPVTQHTLLPTFIKQNTKIETN